MTLLFVDMISILVQLILSQDKSLEGNNFNIHKFLILKKMKLRKIIQIRNKLRFYFD